MIAVWQALEKGIKPGPEYVLNRMRDYTRKLNRPSRHEENLEYDDELSGEASPYGPREKEFRVGMALDSE